MFLTLLGHIGLRGLYRDTDFAFSYFSKLHVQLIDVLETFYGDSSTICVKRNINCFLPQAVANSTSATFLRVVGSEIIQKYLGDGPKLVRELFRVADDLSPSIVFIDEIDAVGTKR